MTERYENRGYALDPIMDGEAVSPSDSVDLTDNTRGLYVGVSGDVKVNLELGATITLVGLAAGVIHPIKVRRVWATGTDATSIVALR